MRANRSARAADQAAQTQVVETMIVGMFVVAAVVAVTTLNVPVTTTESFKRDTERLVQDSLHALVGRPSEDPMFGSVLEEYVMEALAGNERPLRDYLNLTLPAGAQFNVNLDNGFQGVIPVLSSGTPPKEAVAGTLSFVPKLAYVFSTPQFAYYHGDFPQGVYLLPLQQGRLLHDEGTVVEASVTYHEVDGEGNTGPSYTHKTYSQTALRYNDPSGRAWPSASVYVSSGTDRRYTLDASGAPLVPVEELAGSPLGAQPGLSVYNITIPIKIEETGEEALRKGTMVRVELPRGWEMSEQKLHYNAEHHAPGNTRWWKAWTASGNWSIGTTVTATLKAESAGPIWLNVSANYGTVAESASPYFTGAQVNLQQGTQGVSHIAIKPPAANVVGALRRAVDLSVPKPILSEGTSYWGVNLLNMASTLVVERVAVRQPDGSKILHSVTHQEGSHPGSWTDDAANVTFTWTPQHGHLTIPAGEWLSLTLKVHAGYTRDNSYRNQDYLPVQAYYDPENVTAPNTNLLGEWNYTKRVLEWGGHWVYLAEVPPAEADGAAETRPGWPDQALTEYWARAAAYPSNDEMLGSSRYTVMPSGFSSTAFSDYHGGHVTSRVEIGTADGPRRVFTLGERVQITSDFRTVYGQASALDEAPGIDVTDYTLRTSIYTPELAWTGRPSAVFEQPADVAIIGEPFRIHTTDVDADGVRDVIYVTTTGGLYALDGIEGPKLWTYQAGGTPTTSALMDLDLDGRDELVMGFTNGTLRGYRLDVLDPQAGQEREIFAHTLEPLPDIEVMLANEGLQPPAGPYQAVDVLALERATASGGQTNLVFAANLGDYSAFLQGLRIYKGNQGWKAESVPGARHELEVGPAVRVRDIEPVRLDGAADGPPTHVAYVTDLKQVVLLDVDQLDPVWISPVDQVPSRAIARDLDLDGRDDLVVDTHVESGGTHVYALSGASGHWRPELRRPELNVSATKAVFNDEGHLVVVTGTRQVIENAHGLAELVPTRPRLADGTMLDQPWVDVQVVDGAFVIMSDRGHFWRSAAVRGEGGFVWEELPFTADPALNLMAFYMEPGADDVYRFDDRGSVFRHAPNGTWTEIGRACAEAGIPNFTAIGCDDLQLHEWQAVQDEYGNLLLLVARLGSGATPAHKVVSFDIMDQGASAWQKESPSPDEEIWSIDATTDGVLWMSGLHHGKPSILSKQARATGGWGAGAIVGASHTELATIRMLNATTGFVVNTTGHVWATGDGLVWTPVPVREPALASEYAIASPTASPAWIFGPAMAHTPLITHAAASHADYIHNLDEWVDSVPIEVLTTEALPAQPGGAKTSIEAQVSADGHDWITLEKDPVGNAEPGYLSFRHAGVLDCSGCSAVHLRFALHSGASLSNPDFANPGLTPILRSAQLTSLNATGLQLFLESPRTGSTATWSVLHQGLVNPAERTPWQYRTTPSPGGSVDSRNVAASASQLGAPGKGPAVAIIERHGGLTSTWLLQPWHHTLLERAGGPDSGDTVRSVLFADVGDDGHEDLIMAGRLGAAERVRLWNVSVEAATDSLLLLTGSALAVDNAGPVADEPRIAAMTSEGGILSFGRTAPSLEEIWSTDPTAAQGLTSFAYRVPQNSLFGTVAVVTELRFVVTEGGEEVLQAARLLDWFDVTAPNVRRGDVPMPYRVEIIAWFNES